ncbi:MAG TPA: CDP-alcohol phosphatidyltransferase family protein [Candidatus Deferrimicrobiaceae bacterium]|nr:CDP-alcohol phosphatidyltransferase family protein [Candidatus Deferrimicrobiaceae bacterium]
MTGSLVSPTTRQRVRDLATPIARGLGRLGLTPNALTVIGFAGTCVAGLAAAGGAWLLAGVLVLAFGIFDLFDGALARATGRVSRFGAFLDSTLDRAGEAVVYVGVMAGFLGAELGTGAILAATAMASAFLVSYVRAKAESLDYSPGSGMMTVGLAPREVRVVILAVGLLFAGLAAGRTGLDGLAAALALISVFATITTIQRILHVRGQSKGG